ncbi:hypothetical protein [Alteromonas sp. C1M14]|uniref:hypothetical protein n=1 Tax=Alteromonas sp. C1M14 TaxID=2841567 RepID=UPI001C08B1B1|nr:hypothetical protein [Alteromonas sp. C1M14]MBU2977099.1 hypothetical protein [Alteromonas sp. C1M14]
MISILAKLTPLILLSQLIVGCANIVPITSSPPYSKIDIESSFSFGESNIFLIDLNFPKGTYLPIYEDEDGYYYEAPHKLTGNDGGIAILIDGGIYLDKDKNEPDKIYIIRSSFGSPTILSMDEKPSLKLVK